MNCQLPVTKEPCLICLRNKRVGWKYEQGKIENIKKSKHLWRKQIQFLEMKIRVIKILVARINCIAN